eukprot:Selendium_serpulae@DN4765_c0_g1_i2.p2
MARSCWKPGCTLLVFSIVMALNADPVAATNDNPLQSSPSSGASSATRMLRPSILSSRRQLQQARIKPKPTSGSLFSRGFATDFGSAHPEERHNLPHRSSLYDEVTHRNGRGGYTPTSLHYVYQDFDRLPRGHPHWLRHPMRPSPGDVLELDP